MLKLFFDKQKNDHVIFAHYAMEACFNVLLDYLSKKHHILTADLYHQVKLFDEKLYI